MSVFLALVAWRSEYNSISIGIDHRKIPDAVIPGDRAFRFRDVDPGLGELLPQKIRRSKCTMNVQVVGLKMEILWAKPGGCFRLPGIFVQ